MQARGGEKMKVYLDNAATTPVRKEVLEEMQPFFSGKFGNSSSLHSFGLEAKEGIEKAREKIASVLGVKPSEIIFTSGATEADNFALKGAAFSARKQGKKHLVTTAIEHHAVLHTAQWLETQGFDVTYLPVDEFGLVTTEQVSGAIRDDTFLVSVMAANNEIGTIQPWSEIAKICSERGVPFHTDAVQAFGRIPLTLDNVDMLSLSAHKIYGPKGTGLLMVKEGVALEPLIHGGGHQRGKRSGTENVAGAAGFAKAVELAEKEREKESKRQRVLRDRLIEGALQIPDSRLNGHPKKRLCNNANFSFSFIEGEALVLRLDERGIAASTGSACSSPNLEPSHVLLALGLKPSEAHGSLRLTLGRHNSAREIDYALEVLSGAVAELRKISPFGKHGG